MRTWIRDLLLWRRGPTRITLEWLRAAGAAFSRHFASGLGVAGGDAAVYHEAPEDR